MLYDQQNARHLWGQVRQFKSRLHLYDGTSGQETIVYGTGFRTVPRMGRESGSGLVFSWRAAAQRPSGLLPWPAPSVQKIPCLLQPGLWLEGIPVDQRQWRRPQHFQLRPLFRHRQTKSVICLQLHPCFPPRLPGRCSEIRQLHPDPGWNTRFL